MKNIKNLLMAAVALLSMSSTASLIQPSYPPSEDTPYRVAIGLKSGLVKNPNGTGVNNIGGGIGFTHNVGYDFFWGLAASYDWASLGHNRVFGGNEHETGYAGSRIEVELSLGFMPEVAERFHVGGLFGFGWGHLFNKTVAEEAKALGIAFGDLNLRVGPAFSYGFTDMCGIYFAPAYTLTGIRFAKGDSQFKELIKENSNLSGVELPVGLYFGASENVGFYLDVNTKFTDLRENHRKDSWREDFTLGMTFAM